MPSADVKEAIEFNNRRIRFEHVTKDILELNSIRQRAATSLPPGYSEKIEKYRSEGHPDFIVAELMKRVSEVHQDSLQTLAAIAGKHIWEILPPAVVTINLANVSLSREQEKIDQIPLSERSTLSLEQVVEEVDVYAKRYNLPWKKPNLTPVQELDRV
jgi:hypothetical protein